MIEIKKCQLNELNDLRELSKKTFIETFASLNTENAMLEYLEKSFNSKKLTEEILNNKSSFYFIFFEDKLAGYLKVNEVEAQTDIHDPNSLEIQRIYILKEFQGNKLGHALMNKAINIAKQKNKKYIWLGVWEKNIKAINFYENHNFHKTGKHSFFVGDDKQTDYIMKKEIT